jgi:hypothetical protein
LNSSQVNTLPGGCMATILSHHTAAGPHNRCVAYLSFSLSLQLTVLSFLSVSNNQSSASIGSGADAKGSGLVFRKSANETPCTPSFQTSRLRSITSCTIFI